MGLQDKQELLENKELKVKLVCEVDLEFLDSLVQLVVWEQKDVLEDQDVLEELEPQERKVPLEQLEHKVLPDHLAAM